MMQASRYSEGIRSGIARLIDIVGGIHPLVMLAGGQLPQAVAWAVL